jgi:hypothetical protein
MRASFMATARRPSSAAIAGIVFAIILIVVIALFRSAASASPVDTGRWIDDAARRDAVSAALGLIPFAGIAFLWFIAVARSLLGSREDRFFETVFLGSGLLFVATLFVAAAVLATVIKLDNNASVPTGLASTSWVFATTLLGEFGTRMAAVFALALSTAALRIASLPRWLGFTGYATGLTLLLTPPLPLGTQVVFPLWVAIVSSALLLGRSRVAVENPTLSSQ